MNCCGTEITNATTLKEERVHSELHLKVATLSPGEEDRKLVCCIFLTIPYFHTLRKEKRVEDRQGTGGKERKSKVEERTEEHILIVNKLDDKTYFFPF